MLCHYGIPLLMLLHSAFCFPRGKTTEKPEVPLMVNSKPRKATHISEFTDPDTGLNPFLDLEEGLTSMGRNVMEDERHEEPYFGIDLVEGDAPDRRWNLQEPKEHLARVPSRRPEQDYKDESDFTVETTPLFLPNPPTTVEILITKDMENVKSEFVEKDKEIEHKVKKEEKGSFAISQSTVIYATATIAVMTVIVLLVGACWCRRKLKTSRSSSTVENGEVKS